MLPPVDKVDHAVASEDDAAAKARVAVVGLGHQQIPDVGERAALETAACQRRCAPAVLRRVWCR